MAPFQDFQGKVRAKSVEQGPRKEAIRSGFSAIVVCLPHRHPTRPVLAERLQDRGDNLAADGELNSLAIGRVRPRASAGAR